MTCETKEYCPGEILYASSYGGAEDYTFVKSIEANTVWLEAVKEMKAVMCESSETLWLDFDLNTATVLAEDNETGEIDPYLLFARRYCYKQFCETYCGYFGITEICGYLYRMFSQRHKVPPDVYDFAYADFVDSLLEDVRFIVCIRKRVTTTNTSDLTSRNSGIAGAPIDSTHSPARTEPQVETAPTSLFSIVDNYIDDELLETDMDYADSIGANDSRAAAPSENGSFDLDAWDDRRSSYGSLTPSQIAVSESKLPAPQRGRPPCITKFVDYIANSPAAADTAPDAPIQDLADAVDVETASMGSADAKMDTKKYGENENSLAHMPKTILFDSATDSEKVISYETISAEPKYLTDEAEIVFNLAGLFDEPIMEPAQRWVQIEITYAVRLMGKVLHFTAINVHNGHFKKTGQLGIIKFSLDEFVSALRSFDSNARVINPAQLDLYTFEIDLDSLHPVSLLLKQRKLYLRFDKSDRDRR